MWVTKWLYVLCYLRHWLFENGKIVTSYLLKRMGISDYQFMTDRKNASLVMGWKVNCDIAFMLFIMS